MCTECGHAAISSDSTCARCGGLAKAQGGEIMRKTFDQPDLKKGL